MNFTNYVDQVFPGVVWTNDPSDTHVSLSGAILLKGTNTSSKDFLVSSVIKLNLIDKIIGSITKKCPKGDWMYPPEQMAKLFSSDFANLLDGKKMAKSPDKIINTQTGNAYHWVAVWEDKNLIAGLRWWVMRHPVSADCVVGWRFRIQAPNESVESTRRQASEVIKALKPGRQHAKEAPTKAKEDTPKVAQPLLEVQPPQKPFGGLKGLFKKPED